MINDIAQHIHNNSLGTLATNLFIGHMPDTPNNCITIYETGGLPPSIELPRMSPTFQILIRNTSYATGRALLTSIRTLFHQKYNTQLVPNGTYFLSINVQGEGGSIGRDEIGLEQFSINFICQLRT